MCTSVSWCDIKCWRVAVLLRVLLQGGFVHWWCATVGILFGDNPSMSVERSRVGIMTGTGLKWFNRRTASAVF